MSVIEWHTHHNTYLDHNQVWHKVDQNDLTTVCVEHTVAFSKYILTEATSWSRVLSSCFRSGQSAGFQYTVDLA